jgi:hypothetical protein
VQKVAFDGGNEIRKMFQGTLELFADLSSMEREGWVNCQVNQMSPSDDVWVLKLKS